MLRNVGSTDSLGYFLFTVMDTILICISGFEDVHSRQSEDHLIFVDHIV